MDNRPSEATELWWLDLDSLAAEKSDWELFLVPEELEHASRFAFPLLQQRFCVARAGLRQIVASYCGVHPRELILRRDEFGKPRSVQCPKLEFNLSHSGGVALVAITSGERNRVSVGVDLELLRPEIDWQGISSQVFHPLEQAAVQTWGTRGFFGIWTRKEAWLKAQGTGWTEQAKRVSVIDEEWIPNQTGFHRVEAEEQTWWVGTLTPVGTGSAEWASALCQGELNLPICWRSGEDLDSLWAR